MSTVIVVEKVADVGVVDAGEQGEDSLLMGGGPSFSDRDVSDCLAPQMEPATDWQARTEFVTEASWVATAWCDR